MAIARKWGSDDGQSLLADEPAAAPHAARAAALVQQCRADLAQAHERLVTARALMEQSRRLRHPMLPQCRCD